MHEGQVQHHVFLVNIIRADLLVLLDPIRADVVCVSLNHVTIGVVLLVAVEPLPKEPGFSFGSLGAGGVGWCRVGEREGRAPSLKMSTLKN